MVKNLRSTDLARAENCGRGILHLIQDGYLYASHGHQIVRKKPEETQWTQLCKVPVSIYQQLIAKSRLLSRLRRSGVAHIRITTDNRLLVAGFDQLYRYNLATGQWESSSPIQGGRILHLAASPSLICYGEYKSNADAGSVALMCSRDQGITWQIAHEFKNIRHIHTVTWDNYGNCFWITTGDTNKASGFWRTDAKLEKIEKVIASGQSARAVQPIFSADFVYYGTDTLEQQNFLYRFDRVTLELEQLHPVPSAVFYGQTVGERLCFASNCEPKSLQNTVNLFVSSVCGTQWQEIGYLKKDLWHKQGFQYGNILFPVSDGSLDKHLYFTPFATQADQSIRRIPL